MSPQPVLVDIEPVVAEPRGRVRRAALRQRWTELAYFHWPYPPEVVQRRLPPGVRVDTFDGMAWVGLIPFEMRDVRVGPLPTLPLVSDFIEVNVRTYVLDRHGRRAVWFFSLDVPRSLVVAAARTVFSLPYCWAPAEHHVGGDDGREHRYRIARRWPRRPDRPEADLRFTVGARLPDDDVDDLDHFLTARWALVARGRRSLRWGRVEHERWPLHRIDDLSLSQNLVEAAGLPTPVGPPHARFSPGVTVRLAWFESLPSDGGSAT